METHVICILFFISAVSKVHLKLAWHLDGNRAYVWLFMFPFFSSFLLLFLASSHFYFSSSFTPFLLLSLFLAVCISSTWPLHFLFLLPLYNLPFGSFALYVFAFCHLCFPSSSIFWHLPPPLPTLSSSLSVLFCLSLRSQWVWLRGECGVPPLSLAIKAMPTPRLHMSSRPSKRGGVLLIRSAPTFHAKRPSVYACFGCFGCYLVCFCLAVSLTKKCPSHDHKSTIDLKKLLTRNDFQPGGVITYFIQAVIQVCSIIWCYPCPYDKGKHIQMWD